MGLTIGAGPFGRRPGGVFNFTYQSPPHSLYFEDSPRRVRAEFNGETIAQSDHMKLLHETGITPIYYFPLGDIVMDFLEPSDHTTHCPFKGDASYWNLIVNDRRVDNVMWSYPEPVEGAPPLKGYATFYFNKMDAWYEENDQIFVHARDPYNRVDVVSSSRHIRVSLDGEVLAETTRAKLLFETGLSTRYYIPPEDVATDRLVRTDTTSECPYKGTASYYSVEGAGEEGKDLVWFYEQPRREGEDVQGYLCFFNERVDLEVDGAKLERPAPPK